MILTVTPNPAVDVTVVVPRWRPGETHRVPTATHRAGGKGINVTRVLAGQGIDSTAIAPVDDAAQSFFRADLPGRGHRLVSTSAATRTTRAIVETETGVATMFSEAGAPQGAHVWAEVRTAVSELLSAADCVVISGSLPPGTPPAFVGELVSMVRAARIPVIADVVGAALVSAARAGASLLKPNEAELAGAVGDGGVGALLALGAEAVLLSKGANGMELSVPGRDTLIVRPAALRGNATGAGDAAVAAAASVLAAGGVVDRNLLLRASAWAAAAVLHPLAGELVPIEPEWLDSSAVTAPCRSTE